MKTDIKQFIESGQAVLGIEFGSTRIKAVLVNPDGNILETGIFDWENHLESGIWTYGEEEIWNGLQHCYKNLVSNVSQSYGAELTRLSSIGISAMMHGYMAFDKNGLLLIPFRTWRNNITTEAAKQLSSLFRFNIPQRWSIAHLYQAILNHEEHVDKIDYICTLSAYVHWKLTGQRVVGIGDASGMFPIDTDQNDYDTEMLKKFDELISDYHFPWQTERILPGVLTAGTEAGSLTECGARLIDPSGRLQAGCKMCPPEGDAGTGMTATNSVGIKTGNISAGTSAFAMVVLEKPLTRVYENLDIVTTPDGKPVAMAHSNNCTSDINAWVRLFGECLEAFQVPYTEDKLYEVLFQKALDGSEDCGGLLAYCFYSGEHGVGLTKGCPLFLHPENARFHLPNFMRVHLYTAFGAMKLGMDTLMKQEQVKIDCLIGHGGIFKTKEAAQKILAAAMGVPIAVCQTASEGGAWGIALLAAYLDRAREGMTLDDYLNNIVFKDFTTTVIQPTPDSVKGYEKFMERYKKGLPVEYSAVAHLDS